MPLFTHKEIDGFFCGVLIFFKHSVFELNDSEKFQVQKSSFRKKLFNCLTGNSRKFFLRINLKLFHLQAKERETFFSII
jgi:hypothetical protein